MDVRHDQHPQSARERLEDAIRSDLAQGKTFCRVALGGALVLLAAVAWHSWRAFRSLAASGAIERNAEAVAMVILAAAVSVITCGAVAVLVACARTWRRARLEALLLDYLTTREAAEAKGDDGCG